MIGRCIDLSASAASRIGEKSDYLSGVTYWTNPYLQHMSKHPPFPICRPRPWKATGK